MKNTILKNNLFKAVVTSSIAFSTLLSPVSCSAAKNRQNNSFERTEIINIKDPIGDDKGTGYYQYPLDKRLKRGTFDIKNFKVYEEGEVIVFEIQMRGRYREKR